MSSEMRQCPHCEEMIRIDALKCRYCREWISEPTSVSNDPKTIIQQSLAVDYEILDKLGDGGMATVYKARQIKLDRIVALKVLALNLIHDQEIVTRFHREARTAARLNHPNIVTVYDEGAVGNVHYIAMEYLEGIDLHEKVKEQGVMPIAEVVDIAKIMAEALGYVHKQGLVHRDVKSSNIFLTTENRPVLMDFGIVHSTQGKTLTLTGSIIGTPEYMSPEQTKPESTNGIDGRSDLYSLGVVLYECLTGRVPFKDPNFMVTFEMIRNEVPEDPRVYGEDLPDSLVDVILLLLAKDRGDRFQDSEALIQRLSVGNAPEEGEEKEHIEPLNGYWSQSNMTDGDAEKDVEGRDEDKDKTSDDPAEPVKWSGGPENPLPPERPYNLPFWAGAIITIIIFGVLFTIIMETTSSRSSGGTGPGGADLTVIEKKEPPPPPPEPPKVNIKEKLQKAREYITQRNLTTPAGANAWDLVKDVLYLDVRNVEAQALRKEIAGLYERWGDVHQRKREYGSAIQDYSKSLAVINASDIKAKIANAEEGQSRARQAAQRRRSADANLASSARHIANQWFSSKILNDLSARNKNVTKVLLFDSFSNNNENWLLCNDNDGKYSQVLDGSYVVQSKNGESYNPVRRITHKNIIIRCDVKNVNGRQNYGAGLRVRGNDTGDLRFLVSNGNYSLSKYKNGWETIIGWKKHSSIKKNDINTLEMMVWGSFVRLYVNGIFVDDCYTFNDVTGRWLGFTLGGSKERYKFDNLCVIAFE